MRSAALGVLLTGVLLAFATRARADETHYQNVFMGDRAFGMGGASTGLAAGTAAVFYNPAALAELPNRSFSASLGLNAFERFRITDGARASADAADLVQEGRRSLPVFSAALLRFGPRGDDGLKRHAVAFATVHPASNSRTLRVDLIDPLTQIVSTANVEHSFRQTMYGLSYALHISDEIAIGVTVFLATQQLNHSETVVGGNGGVMNPDGTFSGVDTFSALVTFRSRSFALLPRLAVFWRPDHTWSFGATFQTPMIPLRSRARLREQLQLTEFDAMTGDNTQTFALNERRDLGVRLQIPWMLRVGAAVHPTEHATIALDVIMHGRVRSRELITGLNDEVGTGFFLPRDTARRTTVDLSVGVEWTLHDGVTIRTGAFTNRSAAPDVPLSSDIYRVEQINAYGATLGVGAHVGGYHLTFGIAGQLGRGDALSANTNPLTDDLYARTRVEQRVIYFFITGATRSAARLARAALHTVRARRQDGGEDDGGGEGDGSEAN